MGDSIEVGVSRGSNLQTQQWAMDVKIKTKLKPDEWEKFKLDLCEVFKKHNLKPPPGLC